MKTIYQSVKTIFFVFSFAALEPVFAIEIKDYEKKIKTNYAIKNVVDKISRKKLEDDLQDFIRTSRPGRLVGTPGHLKAQSGIEEKLKAAAGTTSTFSKEEFTVTLEGGKVVNAANLIWEKKGLVKPDEVIIIGAHYDSIIKDEKTGKIVATGEMPGADNNATGVVALLSMIEIFSKLDLPKTVKIVFFDAQELEQAGSKTFIDRFIPVVGNQRVFGFIDLKMIGHDSKREDKMGKLGNMKFYTRPQTMKGHEQDTALSTALLGHGKRLYPMIDFTSSELSFIKVTDAVNGFWQLGIPGIIVTQDRENDFNPRFQTSNDFYETINLMTYNNVFRFLTSAVLAWNYDMVK